LLLVPRIPNISESAFDLTFFFSPQVERPSPHPGFASLLPMILFPAGFQFFPLRGTRFRLDLLPLTSPAPWSSPLFLLRSALSRGTLLKVSAEIFHMSRKAECFNTPPFPPGCGFSRGNLYYTPPFLRVCSEFLRQPFFPTSLLLKGLKKPHPFFFQHPHKFPSWAPPDESSSSNTFVLCSASCILSDTSSSASPPFPPHPSPSGSPLESVCFFPRISQGSVSFLTLVIRPVNCPLFAAEDPPRSIFLRALCVKNVPPRILKSDHSRDFFPPFPASGLPLALAARALLVFSLFLRNVLPPPWPLFPAHLYLLFLFLLRRLILTGLLSPFLSLFFRNAFRNPRPFPRCFLPQLGFPLRQLPAKFSRPSFSCSD